MLKKHENIITKMLSDKDIRTSKVGYHEGFYYATDGYRIVRFHDRIENVPMFKSTDKQFEYLQQYQTAYENDYDSIEIPYTIEQIKSWIKAYSKIDKTLIMPFKLGETIHLDGIPIWVGINPYYLIDAMETTQSNIIHIPHEGRVLLMKNENFTWLISPIALQGYEKDKHMTKIENNKQ